MGVMARDGKGEGTERDLVQALELYKTVAEQDREAEATRRAQEALMRLGTTSVPSAASHR